MLLTPDRVRRLLADVRAQRLSVREAYAKLQAWPYEELGFATLDTHRAVRRRYPEVIFCEGKTAEQVARIVEHLAPIVQPLVLTRVSADLFHALNAQFPKMQYHAEARMATWGRPRPTGRGARSRRWCLVITAGTADLPVAHEARVTLEVLGHRVRQVSDVGVAGLHRLTAHVGLIQRASVIVACAGMDGALPSIVGGLAGCPVIAVPTSVGYGASFHGIGALLTMLNSCAPGVVVVNIDNGFGAAYFAGLLLDRGR